MATFDLPLEYALIGFEDAGVWRENNAGRISLAPNLVPYAGLVQLQSRVRSMPVQNIDLDGDVPMVCAIG